MTKLIIKFNILLLLFGFISIKSALAQSSFTLDASQLYTTFKFQDSQGNKDNSYSGNFTGAYSIGYRYVHESGLLLRANVGMRKAGATLVYDDANYMWDLQYADGRLGVGYMLTSTRVKPYLTASGYYAYLLKANQTLNQVNYDIKEANALSKTDYGIVASPGVQLELSEYFSVYAEASYLMGLQNIENKAVEASGSGQKGYNQAYGLTLGLSFSIK